MDTPTATYQRVSASFGTGKVHVAGASRVLNYHVLGCSGRAVDGCVPTDKPVTCGSCLRRFAGDAALLGVPAEQVVAAHKGVPVVRMGDAFRGSWDGSFRIGVICWLDEINAHVVSQGVTIVVPLRRLAKQDGFVRTWRPV